nr:RNA-guided endonuclease TnpB family protein [Trichodesmium sp. MO_231.B1]
NPKAYRQAKKRLTRYQRRVNKKESGFLRNATQTKNRAKAVKRLAKLHKKVADIRADALHKLTTWLAKNHSTIVIEDLNVSGMLKNHKLASAIADCGFYEFKCQLSYKCEWYGSKLVIAPRFYPSSQICSHCGHQQKMPLSMRNYECGNCGFKADRDFNAAVNLENYARQ